MDPEQVKAAIEALKNNDAAAALEILQALIVAAATDEATEVEPPSDPLAQMADPPKPEEAVAALTSLRTLSGQVNLGEAVAFITKLKAEADKTLAQAAVLEESSRLGLIGELVKLGVETPATAWEGDPAERKPSKFLAAMPIADLRGRVKALSGAKPAPGFTPPASGGGETVTLSAAETAAAKRAGMSPEQFITAKKNAVKRA